MTIHNVGRKYLSGSMTSGDLGGSPTAGGGASNDCGNVLTTLACTLAEDDITHGTSVGKNPLLAEGGADQCGSVLTTLVCTLDADTTAKLSGDAILDDCKHVLWTAGCTFTDDAQQADAADCKHVMWTAGCTFAEPASGEGCHNYGWTVYCTGS